MTLADATQGGLPWREVPPYLVAQVIGAFAGVAVAHVMFGEPTFSASTHVRAGLPQLVSEFVATFGLLSVIWGCVRRKASAVPFAVGAYITAAYWFTSSTSFANPAVSPSPVGSATRSPVSGQWIFPGSSWLNCWAPAPQRSRSAGSCPPLPMVADRVVDRREGDLPMKTVLFACVHNAGRFLLQMVAAWFNLSSPTLRRRWPSRRERHQSRVSTLRSSRS